MIKTIVLLIVVCSILMVTTSADTGDFVDDFNGDTLNATLWDEEPRGVAGSVVTIGGGIAYMNPSNSTSSISIRTNGTFNISEFRYRGNSSTTYRYGTMSIGSGDLVGIDGATSWWYTTLYNGYVIQLDQANMLLLIMQDGVKTQLATTPMNSGAYKNYTLYTNSTGVHIDVDDVLTLTSSNTTFTSGDILISQGSHVSVVRDGYVDWAKGYNITTDSIDESADINVTHWNPGSGSLVATYCVTNITAGVSSINILLNVTRDTWKYTLTYSNDTEISNQTATSTNESLNFSLTTSLNHPLAQQIRSSSTGLAAHGSKTRRSTTSGLSVSGGPPDILMGSHQTPNSPAVNHHLKS